MSPTSPTFVALNNQLNKAHHRIRELEARETELLARIRSLCAVITERTRDGQHDRQAAARESPGVQDVSQRTGLMIADDPTRRKEIHVESH